jgi:hypothetical protein
VKEKPMSVDTPTERNIMDDQELQDRLKALEVGQATGAATLAGAQVTQAATDAGMTTTNAAAHAGTIATVVAGSVALIVGIFLGMAIRGARAVV